MLEFQAWPKTKRHEKPLQITVTEKIDGTNAQIHIVQVPQNLLFDLPVITHTMPDENYLCTAIMAGSRTRYITPQNDNAGFAKWVDANAFELLQLGEGRHFGEWYGNGIQRNYGMGKKMFALFNTTRWAYTELPKDVCTVPVLYEGDYVDHKHLLGLWETLRDGGSMATCAEGFAKPEGLVVWFHDFGTYLKMPMDK